MSNPLAAALPDEAELIELPATLDRASLRRLRARLEAPTGRRVRVLAGGGDAFCRGMDMAALEGLDRAAIEAGLLDYVACALAVRSGGSAAVAAVDGDAFGGGLGLAAACDVVVCGPGARFALPEALLGFYPAIVATLLAERLSAQQVRLLALRAESIDGALALALGLADALADGDRLAKTVRRECIRLRRAQPRAVAAIRAEIRQTAELETALRRAAARTLELTDNATVRGLLAAAAADGRTPT